MTKIISENKMFDGIQRVYEHDSDTCHCTMRFGAFLPNTTNGDNGTLFWLSGLTCTEQNFVTKAGAQRLASELGLTIIAPDTSPRGDGVPDDSDGNYDFGLGAGFYLNATHDPWAKHYRMYDYIAKELPEIVTNTLSVNQNQLGIFGHSMGGHGALTIHLKNPDLFRSVSAFAPIVSPSSVPWGKKALLGYLGDDKSVWRDYDACALVQDSSTGAHILIDQGESDEFLESQLKPSLFADACNKSNQKLTLRMQPGFDHSYYFMASFIDDHLRHHHRELNQR